MARSTPIAARLEKLQAELEQEHDAVLMQKHGWLTAKPLDQVIAAVEAARLRAVEEQL
jgi:hypothetical protein